MVLSCYGAAAQVLIAAGAISGDSISLWHLAAKDADGSRWAINACLQQKRSYSLLLRLYILELWGQYSLLASVCRDTHQFCLSTQFVYAAVKNI